MDLQYSQKLGLRVMCWSYEIDEQMSDHFLEIQPYFVYIFI